MLIGGMFEVDTDLAQKKPGKIDFPLRFDTKNEYSRKVYTNNGRTASTYVFEHGINLKKGEKVLIPEYTCISVLNALEAVNAKFDVYKVKPGLVIDIEDLESKIDEKCRVIYLIHYFGFPQPQNVVEKIKLLAKKHNLLILEDLTQAVLTKNEGRIGFADYVIMSTRKWYPVTDGGVVAARDGANFEIVDLPDGYDEAVFRQLAISLKRKNFDIKTSKVQDYLVLEKQANKARYYDFTPKKMTEMSQNILFLSNHKSSISKRCKNYKYLYKNLQNLPGLKVWGEKLEEEAKNVPFGFMVLVENRTAFYNFLVNRGIVGEIQWVLPEGYYQPSEYAMYLTKHSLMLQCDQRYGLKEMEQTVKVIREYCAEIVK